NDKQVETVFVTRSEEAMAKSGLKLFPGDRVDFVLDANGQHSYDATGLTLSITCDEAHDEWQKYSLYTAAMENLKSTTPTAHFTGSDGGVWTMGTYGIKTGFTPDQFTQGTVVYNGAWGGFTKSGSVKYPYMMINTNGVAGTVWDVTTTYAKEFAHHPVNENTYSAARFHAPTDGVYRMTGYLKAFATSTDGNGLELNTVVNSGQAYPTNGIASGSGVNGPKTLNFDTGDVWLKANGTLDMVLGRNGAWAYDASAFSVGVESVDFLPSANRYVSFDVVAAGGTPYAGGGKVGTSADNAWTALEVAGGATACSRWPVTGGTKRAVRLSLSRTSGTLSTAAAGSVAGPITCGVVSAGSSDSVAFELCGLKAGASYDLYFYSYHTSGANGAFTVGGETVMSREKWFNRLGGGDWCMLTATADVNGKILGTFASAEASTAAAFSGLQLFGDEIPAYIPPGMLVTFQ
ncbi:MAG: hypothetical protein PHV28_09155, partial [Kiritimatiellae bacterium]|nr:hypothetical protein [Kiritimatiellia bacterium]